MGTKPKYTTSEDYRLLSLMPAPSGIQAVYMTNGDLECVPICLIGVAEITHKRYHIDTDGQRGRMAGKPLVYNGIVGVEYDPQDGFSICDETTNFCGVAMPGQDIAEVSYRVSDFDEHEKAVASHKERQGAKEQERAYCEKNAFRGI